MLCSGRIISANSSKLRCAIPRANMQWFPAECFCAKAIGVPCIIRQDYAGRASALLRILDVSASLYQNQRKCALLLVDFPLGTLLSVSTYLRKYHASFSASPLHFQTKMARSKSQNPSDESATNTPIEVRRRVTKACQRCRLKKCKVRSADSTIID